MQNEGLKSTLDRLGLKQTEFATLLDVSPRTVSLWATGESGVPGPVTAYLRVLQQLTPEALHKELGQLNGRRKMFDEGIYRLFYQADAGGRRETDDALAVLRNGKILGSDRWGGRFTGSYEFDPVNEMNKMHVRLQLPPEGMLVTGFAADAEGATIDIIGDFNRATPTTKARVDVAGRPVDIELEYLGPLPN